ncbi:uncharacterized protein SCHCODRAFT_02666171 [Schizophyllum commune H4-8]|uniref:uncharacterized protein n=1 Tax=Schizophyllum commune (strain H4-8 / FGSC 9210) TaxID=578458 RepID=UPI00215ED23B|nr:uncharacterized protein SCHCODRAFT_02666171 [Schizophyllum commune H4-8]KAI5892995.1 hypothetical protein SCHCODRAFT_02666171 [Schizophyllum commune H4-8]
MGVQQRSSRTQNVAMPGIRFAGNAAAYRIIWVPKTPVDAREARLLLGPQGQQALAAEKKDSRRNCDRQQRCTEDVIHESKQTRWAASTSSTLAVSGTHGRPQSSFTCPICFLLDFFQLRPSNALPTDTKPPENHARLIWSRSCDDNGRLGRAPSHIRGTRFFVAIHPHHIDMSSPPENIATALRTARVLSALLKPGLEEIIRARDNTLRCACGKLANGRAQPCNQPICKDCGKNECPRCKKPASNPNPSCEFHAGPCCPYSHGGAYHFVTGHRPLPENGGELLDVTLKQAEHMNELLDHLIVLTRDM